MSHKVSDSNKNTRSGMQSRLDSSVDPYDSLLNLTKTKGLRMLLKGSLLETLGYRVRGSLRSQTSRHPSWSCRNKKE